MRSDVHSAALRAAAKVAFSVAFLAGCSSPAEGENADGTPANTDESDIKSGKKSSCGSEADAATPPKLSCDQIVAAAFPTEGNYPGKKQSVSAEVQTCCDELLVKSGGLSHHRWDCCANLPADAGQSVGIACTPWGPPVPPSMPSRKRRAQLEVA